MRSTTMSAIRRWARRHPLIVDAGLACAVTALGLVGKLNGYGHRYEATVTGYDVLALVISLLAITFRRRWPQQALVVTAAAALVLMAVTGAKQPALLAALGIVACSMASHVGRNRAWATAGAVAVPIYFVDALVTAGSAWSPPSFGLVAWLGMATAFGDATRSRRAYVAEVEERARRAEQTREEEASRRVISERLRIARELHDVVAHHIAVINVQAGAASHVLDRNPEQVRPALTHIRDACDTVLSELGSIVGVLRQSDDPDSTTEPVRGLARLNDVIDTLAAAGLSVEHRQVGQARELPAVVDLAAYRILQEALTNAHKHGTGTATVTITYLLEDITIDVVNTVAAGRTPTRSGYGIIGMTERAATAGGALHAQAQPDGRFTVHADLPAPALKATP